ncbi:MAG: class I SAM-dependent methyltransferase [Methanobacteriota archaeon]
MKEVFECYYDRYHEKDMENDDLTRMRTILVLKYIEPSSKVLDFGCGQGYTTALLSRKSSNITGMDISENALKKASKNYPELKFEKTERLREYAGEFDVIYCGDVLEHLFDVNEVLNKLHKALKIGGTIIVTAPYHSLLKNILICFHNFDTHFSIEGPHIRFFTEKSLKEVISKNGFKIIKVKKIGRFFPIYKSLITVAIK